MTSYVKFFKVTNCNSKEQKHMLNLMNSLSLTDHTLDQNNRIFGYKGFSYGQTHLTSSMEILFDGIESHV